MKKRLFVLLLTSLLIIFTLSGCKKAAENLGALPSEDILDTWETIADVDTGEGVIKQGSFLDINRTSFNLYVNTDVFGWVFVEGSISPDPASSVASVLTVTYSGLTDFIGVGDIINLSYVLSSPDAVIFYLDGDAFSAVPGTMPS